MGMHNNGYDDENHDYILQPGEIFNNRFDIPLIFCCSRYARQQFHLLKSSSLLRGVHLIV